MKRTWTKLLIAVSLFACLLAVRTGPDLLTPILELEQMHREEGVLLSYSRNPKTQDFILVRLNTGDEHSYRGSLGGISRPVENYIGRPVTVWSQRVYEGWPPFVYEGFMEIKQDDKMLLNYRVADRKHLLASDFDLLNFLFYLAIIPFLMVGLVCRKGDCA